MVGKPLNSKCGLRVECVGNRHDNTENNNIEEPLVLNYNRMEKLYNKYRMILLSTSLQTLSNLDISEANFPGYISEAVKIEKAASTATPLFLVTMIPPSYFLKVKVENYTSPFFQSSLLLSASTLSFI